MPKHVVCLGFIFVINLLRFILLVVIWVIWLERCSVAVVAGRCLGLIFIRPKPCGRRACIPVLEVHRNKCRSHG